MFVLFLDTCTFFPPLIFTSLKAPVCSFGLSVFPSSFSCSAWRCGKLLPLIFVLSFVRSCCSSLLISYFFPLLILFLFLVISGAWEWLGRENEEVRGRCIDVISGFLRMFLWLNLSYRILSYHPFNPFVIFVLYIFLIICKSRLIELISIVVCIRERESTERERKKKT